MLVEFKGRDVEVSVTHDKDPVDSYVDDATWIDLGVMLTDEEREQLTQELHETGLLHEMWWDHMQDQADLIVDLDD